MTLTFTLLPLRPCIRLSLFSLPLSFSFSTLLYRTVASLCAIAALRNPKYMPRKKREGARTFHFRLLRLRSGGKMCIRAAHGTVSMTLSLPLAYFSSLAIAFPHPLALFLSLSHCLWVSTVTQFSDVESTGNSSFLRITTASGESRIYARPANLTLRTRNVSVQSFYVSPSHWRREKGNCQLFDCRGQGKTLIVCTQPDSDEFLKLSRNCWFF